MKKFIITAVSSIAFVAIVITFAEWAGSVELPLSEREIAYIQAETEDIIYDADDEDLGANGTLSDGIHNTSSFLNHTLKDASDLSDVLRGIDVIKKYSAGALQLAEEKNAAQFIVEKLKKANQLIQEASSEKDLAKFEKANEILLKLDLNYNGYGILDDSQIEEIKKNNG
ncbi:hypothetical protein [Siminovitchia sp. 179-K 8D1 HS]|uniref:hypothetical protein n=1 Tax=Siminovitchia sp. 179-K 8D1 HS TaxID=3142385 RepID=UPI00399EF408